MRTVGIQESTGNINNFFSSPVQYQTRFFGNNSYYNSFQVFFVGIFHEFVNVFRIYNNSHTFLRLGNSNFCSIQTGIFFRYLIQIDLQSRCQFSDCYRYTACTKVITFLYLGTTNFDRSFCMYFGRTGCTTDTVTAGTST